MVVKAGARRFREIREPRRCLTATSQKRIPIWKPGAASRFPPRDVLSAIIFVVGVAPVLTRIDLIAVQHPTIVQPSQGEFVSCEL